MKFKIPIEADSLNPATLIEIGNLHDEVVLQNQENGVFSCATLGQIHTWSGGSIIIEGQLFTGEAYKYLLKHMKIARDMQDASPDKRTR